MNNSIGLALWFLVTCLSLSRPVFATEAGLEGEWLFEFLGVSADRVSFRDKSHFKQHSILAGALYFDFEADYFLEESSEPDRLLLTVTKTNPNQVVKTEVGSQLQCIFRLTGDLLDLNCSQEGIYPEAFAEGLSYVRVTSHRE